MASWSDAKINMMDEKAEEDMKVLIGLSMKVVLDGEMMKADKEVDEMLFQFAFLLYDTSEHHLAAHCQQFQRRFLLTAGSLLSTSYYQLGTKCLIKDLPMLLCYFGATSTKTSTLGASLHCSTSASFFLLSKHNTIPSTINNNSTKK